MLPLKLRMEAFGSYAEATEIDFTKLGSKGIFLVSGRMGAGKTIIFDAMLYALFGCVTGEERDHLCCTHTGEKQLTRVEFTFSYRGRAYVVERTRKRDKQGRESNKDASIKLAEGETLANTINSTNDYIVELFGIDAKKFKGISILPQGKFREILTANSETRRAMFRDIFHTELFDKLQTRVSDDAKAARAAVESTEAVLNSNIKAITADRSLPLYLQEEWESLPQEGMAARLPQVLVWLEKVCSWEKEQLASYGEEQQELLRQQQQEALLLQELENYLKRWQAAAEAKEKEQQGLAQQEQLTAARLQAEQEAQVVPQLQEENRAIEEHLAGFRELAKCLQEIAVRENRRQVTAKNIEKKNGQREELQRLIQQQEGELNALQSTGAELVKAEQEAGSYKQAIKLCLDLGRAYKAAAEQQQLLQQESLRLKAARDRFTKADERYYAEQAGVLARSLRPGSPCPVCGALEHPQPAVCSEESITKEQVDSLKEQFEAVRRQAEAIRLEKKRLDTTVELAREELERRSQELPLLQGLELQQEETLLKQLREAIAGLQEQGKLVEKNIADLQAQEEHRLALQSRLPLDRKKEQSLGEEQQLLQQELVGLAAELTPLYAARDRLQETLTGLSQEQEEARQRDNCLRIEGLTQQLQQAEKACQQGKELLAKLQGRAELLAQELAALTAAKDKEAAEEGQHQAQLRQQQLQERLEQLRRQEAQLSKEWAKEHTIYEALVKYNSLYAKQLQHYSFLANLDRAFNSRSGIKLETFVQMRYFEKILARANLRLLKMTNDRYELLRDTRDKGGGSKGLGIMVVDHYDSSQRSISDFSGGEGFLASLSLALGMSDEIQSSQGGIKLDSIFVDEGFGTLDPYTLGVTMNVLKDLANKDILVGMISHVKELEENIPRQIVVTKSIQQGRESSRARIVIKD